VGELNYIGHIYLGIIKFIKNVMGFSFSKKVGQKEPQTEMEALQPRPTSNNTENSTNQLQLNRPEVEALLVMIKESTFKGDQVEHVYNLVFKLQEYYKSLTD